MNQPFNPSGGGGDSAAQTFPCESRGAQLLYDASSRGMASQLCGYRDASAARAQSRAMQAAYRGSPSGSIIREFPLAEGLEIIA